MENALRSPMAPPPETLCCCAHSLYLTAKVHFTSIRAHRCVEQRWPTPFPSAAQAPCWLSLARAHS
jgi:hypothetical protein